MPKSATSARSFSAVASQAAYMSPDASPADSRIGMALMDGRINSIYATTPKEKKCVFWMELFCQAQATQSWACRGDGAEDDTSIGRCNSCSLYCNWYNR